MTVPENILEAACRQLQEFAGGLEQRALDGAFGQQAKDQIMVARHVIASVPSAIRGDHPDTARMNWLEKQVVNVRSPALYGSRNMFTAAPAVAEGLEDEPSLVRKFCDEFGKLPNAIDSSGR